MKTEKKQTFRGAVLFTVVCVMSLLIIFLTSTLVLATSAHSRAHKTYASSQAHYTARAAIDSVLAAVTTNDSFATAVSSIANPGDGFDVNIQMEKAGVGKVDKARVAYSDEQYYYDSKTQSWVKKILISITADVTYGGETNTITAYVLKNPPTDSPSGGGGGGFVSVGKAAMANHTSAYGGTYFGIGLSAGQRKYVGDYTDEIGCYVTLDDKLYLNIDTDNGKTEQFDTTTGRYYRLDDDCVEYKTQNDQTIEAPLVINGSFNQPNEMTLVIPDKGFGMAVWGNYTVGNKGLGIEISSDKVKDIKRFNEIPYIYVDGCLKTTNGTTIGSNDIPLNLFLGSVNVNNNNGNIYGNIYCYDKNANSYLGGTGSTLYAWSDSLINKGEMNPSNYTSGNFYTKGNLVISGNTTIKGDLIVEGNLTIKKDKKLNVGGNIIVGGTLKTGNGHELTYSDLYANNASGEKVESNATLRMKADGSGPLIEKKTIYYSVVKNPYVEFGPYDKRIVPYAYIDPAKLGEIGIDRATLDSDGDGKLDGGSADYGIADPKPESFFAGIDYNPLPDKELSESYINTDTGMPATEEDMYEPGSEVKYNGAKLKKVSEYTGTKFPDYAEKAVILGFETIDSKPVEQTKVLETIEEIEVDYSFETRAITTVEAPVRNACEKTYATYSGKGVINGSSYNKDNAPNNGGKEFQITDHATITGSFNNDIRIKATAGKDIWLIVKGNTMLCNGAKIIYDDYGVANAGRLNIFVEGSIGTSGSGSSILTTTYQNLLNNEDFEITTTGQVNSTTRKKASSPNINIFSSIIRADKDEPPLLSLHNLGVITANIEAPYMDFDMVDAFQISSTGRQIYYNGRPVVNSGRDNRLGVIGVLNVREVVEATNNWLFLYVPKVKTPPVDPIPDPGENNWYVVIGYDGF